MVPGTLRPRRGEREGRRIWTGRKIVCGRVVRRDATIKSSRRHATVIITFSLSAWTRGQGGGRGGSSARSGAIKEERNGGGEAAGRAEGKLVNERPRLY